MSSRVLALAPMGSDPDEREFQREARAWLTWYAARGIHGELVTFDPDAREDARRRAVLASLDALAPLAHVAFFCHGLRGSIQPGFTRANVRTLACTLADSCDVGAHVSLYCCSTGGESSSAPSFASLLRSHLVDEEMTGGTVLAHTNAGHTTRNRAVRLLELQAAPTTPPELAAWEGPLVVRPSERAAWLRFKEWLAVSTPNRWRLGTMTREQVRAELGA